MISILWIFIYWILGIILGIGIGEAIWGRKQIDDIKIVTPVRNQSDIWENAALEWQAIALELKNRLAIERLATEILTEEFVNNGDDRCHPVLHNNFPVCASNLRTEECIACWIKWATRYCDNRNGEKIMAKFRKKPVVIDAVRALSRFAVKTREGIMIGEPGDWLLTGIDGEQYLCADEIFRKTYEPVDEDAEKMLRQTSLTID